MARPEAGPRVTVKILVKKYEIAPVGAFGELSLISVPETAAVRGG